MSNLRKRLLIFSALCLLPAFVILFHDALERRDAAIADTEADLLRLAKVAALEQRQLVVHVNQLLAGLARVPQLAVPSSPAACSRTLATIRTPYPYYANIGLITPNGRLFCSALSPRAGAVDLADRSFFRRAVADRTFAVGDYQIGRVTRKATLNFGYPVFDDHGRLRHVLFVALDLAWLKGVIDELPVIPGTVVRITDSQGAVLLEEPASQAATDRTFDDALQKIKRGSGQGVIEVARRDGSRGLYAFEPLYKTRNGQAFVSASIPAHRVYDPVYRSFAYRLLVLALIAVTAVAVAWIALDRLLLARIDKLAQAARRLGRGDLTARTGLPHESRDLGQLAKTFDDMATGLESREREITRVTRALRTLSAGNRALLRATDESGLLNAMCNIAVRDGGYPAACVVYRDPDAELTMRLMASVAASESGAEAIRRVFDSGEGSQSQAAAEGVVNAMRAGRACVSRQSDDVGHSQGSNSDVTRAPSAFRAYLALPLNVDGVAIGAFIVYATELDAFGREEIELLTETADDLGFGIAALRLQSRHRDATNTISRMAYYDELTSLPNRSRLNSRLEQVLAEARSHNRPASLLVLQLHALPEVDRTLGYRQADRLVQSIGPRLQPLLDEAEMLARIGDDRFALLLPGADAERAIDRAQKILHAIAEPVDTGALALDVPASIGIAVFPGHGGEPDVLLRRANAAVSHAQRTGDRWAIYSGDSEQLGVRRLALTADLRHAIENGELHLYCQPKVDIPSRRICGVEVLTRWQHPTHGAIPPEEFIALAEYTGLINPLTYWAVETALRQSYTWRQIGLDVPVAVNLSARNLRDPMLVRRIEALIATWGARPQTLEFELTESALMEDAARSLEVLSRLRKLEIPLFIDDFGTGYSSLSYLQRLPIDAIKVDKSFVLPILTDADSRAIVHSTIQLAHGLDLLVVAEGVESGPVWNELATLGCDIAQGYYISKPMRVDEFDSWRRQAGWDVDTKNVV